MSGMGSMVLGLYLFTYPPTLIDMLGSDQFKTREAASVLILRLAAEDENWLDILEGTRCDKAAPPEVRQRTKVLRDVIIKYEREHYNVFVHFDSKANAEAAVKVLKEKDWGLPLELRSYDMANYHVLRISRKPKDGLLIPFMKTLKGFVLLNNRW